MVASQNVDQSYGLDPSPFATKTAIKTKEKYRNIYCVF